MSLKEFESIIGRCKIYTDNFGSKNVSLHFTLAMMTRVDEVEEDKHINMTFTEFVEAIGRVAECLEVPHPLDDDDVDEEVEAITEEQRETYRNKPLTYKIETLLLYLAKDVCPGGKSFSKHQTTMSKYKKAKLHPNNIDTGNLKL